MKDRKRVTRNQDNKVLVISEKEWSERQNNVLLNRSAGSELPNVDVITGEVEEPLDFLR